MLQFKKAEWAKTVISYSTDKAMRLPVVDVAVRDVGAEDQSFWLEIGLVCYT
jgi:Fibrillar collagen C-terminal domain.